MRKMGMHFANTSEEAGGVTYVARCIRYMQNEEANRVDLRAVAHDQ